MRDISTKFGKNAGRLWAVLNENGCLTKDNVLSFTNLTEHDFYTGLGWLAREDKILRDENNYELSSTNLESEIGGHAGIIWKLLDIWGDLDFESIKRLSDLDDNQVNAALGWLAKEDKIYLDENVRFNLK